MTLHVHSVILTSDAEPYGPICVHGRETLWCRICVPNPELSEPICHAHQKRQCKACGADAAWLTPEQARAAYAKIEGEVADE